MFQMDTSDAFLKTRGNLFAKKSENFRPIFEKGQNLVSFSFLSKKTFLPSKCSKGQTESSFDNRAEAFPMKG